MKYAKVFYSGSRNENVTKIIRSLSKLNVLFRFSVWAHWDVCLVLSEVDDMIPYVITYIKIPLDVLLYWRLGVTVHCKKHTGMFSNS